MNFYQKMLIQMGIQDVSMIASIIIDDATKSFGPKFKAAAEAALAANTAFGIAAMNPAE